MRNERGSAHGNEQLKDQPEGNSSAKSNLPGKKASRRALFSLSAAAAAGALASSFLPSESAEAASATFDSATTDPAVSGTNTGSGPGVAGESSSGPGVTGQSSTGHGVIGRSTSGNGVLGSSQSGNGVQARSLSEGGALNGINVATTSLLAGPIDTTNPANLGSGPGVRGTSGSGVGVTGESQTVSGVLGRTHASNGPAAGVFGWALLPGVGGPPPYSDAQLGPAIGVSGRGKDAGVEGSAPGEAPGVRAVSTTAGGAPDNGLALQVVGKAAFSTAGTQTIPAGTQDYRVANPSVQSSSVVVVTLMSDPGGSGPVLSWAERQPGTGFVVHLTKKALAPIAFGFFIIN